MNKLKGFGLIEVILIILITAASLFVSTNPASKDSFIVVFVNIWLFLHACIGAGVLIGFLAVKALYYLDE